MTGSSAGPGDQEAMYLLQILLPLVDNQGQRFDDHRFSHVRRELTERFGGVTAYLRSPAADSGSGATAQ